MKFVDNPANIYSQKFPNFKLFPKILLVFYWIQFTKNIYLKKCGKCQSVVNLLEQT